MWQLLKQTNKHTYSSATLIKVGNGPGQFLGSYAISNKNSSRSATAQDSLLGPTRLIGCSPLT